MGVQVKRCVIVGAAPVKDYEFLKSRLSDNDYIICADGGVNHLYHIGVAPNLIIGDMDSAIACFPEVKTIKLPAEKDDTDTHYAAVYAYEAGFSDFLFLGVTGARLDHTLANLATLCRLITLGCQAVIEDEDSAVTMVINAQLTLQPVKNTVVSVFAYGGDALGVYERGMKYFLTDAHLTGATPVGVSNEFTQEPAVITVEKGMLIVMVTKNKNNTEPYSRLLRII